MNVPLEPNQLTLRPVGADGDLPLLSLHDDRRILTFPGPRPLLGDAWVPHRLADGRLVEVRRAACGLGCRCAGEYRMKEN